MSRYNALALHKVFKCCPHTHSRAHTVDFVKESNDQAVEIAQV